MCPHIEINGSCPQGCAFCRSCYNDVKAATMRIADHGVRDNLLLLWETLWLNNCTDFDIIADTFSVALFVLKKEK